MALLTPEEIGRQIESLYEDNYATYLAAVQSDWAATEDIALDDFALRRLSADPATMSVVTFWPALLISIGDLREDAGGPQQGQQYQTYYLMDTHLVYWLRHLDDHTLGVLLLRHIEATMRMLIEFPRLALDGVHGIGNLRFEPSANALSSGGNSLAKALRVRFDVRFLQRVF